MNAAAIYTALLYCQDAEQFLLLCLHLHEVVFDEAPPNLNIELELSDSRLAASCLNNGTASTCLPLK